MIEVLGKLVWPVTVIVVVLILRRPLSELVLKTKRLKYKELDVEFNDEIRRIEAEAEEALPTPSPILEKKVSVDLNDLAKISPSAAVAESWRSVENAAKQLIQSKEIEVDYDVHTPYKLIQNVLVKGKLIDERSGKIYQELRQLRNKVVHAEDFELSEEQALDYIRLSMKLKAYFELLAEDKAT